MFYIQIISIPLGFGQILVIEIWELSRAGDLRKAMVSGKFELLQHPGFGTKPEIINEALLNFFENKYIFVYIFRIYSLLL